MNAMPQRVALVAGLLLMSAAAAWSADEIKLDRYEISGELRPGSVILVKQFGTDKADFGKLKKERQKETASNMKTVAPLQLQQVMVQHLAEASFFAEVTAWEEGEAAENALVLEGEFTVINPGNRNKRYWVGMGAGRSRICVEGRLVDSDGARLGTFGDCRSGTGMVGFVGGRAEGMMSNDLYACGINVADFLLAWGRDRLPAEFKGD